MLFVVGLLASLSVPRFASGLQQRELRTQRDSIEDQLRELPRRVRLAARPLRWTVAPVAAEPGSGALALRLDAGWSVAFAPALEISVQGVCSASAVRVELRGEPAMTTHYVLAPITCELTPAPAP